MPIYKQFKPSRKFGEAGENYRDEGSEEKARKQVRSVQEGGYEGATADFEDVATQGFEESGRRITPETAKDAPIDITDTKQKAELRSILRVGDATYDTPTLNQVEEAITLRKEILGETPVGGIKGSVKQDVYEGGQKVGVETKGPESLYKSSKNIPGIVKVDAGTAKEVNRQLRILEKVRVDTVSNINKKSGYTTKSSTDIIDATSDRAIRSLAMSQGVISDFNDANPEKLGSVADYYFLKKSEGKSMSQIKQSFAYDHDFIESGGEYKGINTARDLSADRSVSTMHSTKYTMADRAKNITTQSPKFKQDNQPFRMGPGYDIGMSPGELSQWNRVLPSKVTTEYRAGFGGVQSFEKLAYHHEEYAKAGASVGGPEFKTMFRHTTSIESAEDAGYKFKVNPESGTKYPDMSDVKWQRAMELHKIVEEEAISRTKFRSEFDDAGISKQGDILNYLEQTGRSRDTDIFKDYNTRKSQGTDWLGKKRTTRVENRNWNTKYGSIKNTVEAKDPDELEKERLKKKAKKIPLGGGAAGLGVILRGGGGRSLSQ